MYKTNRFWISSLVLSHMFITKTPQLLPGTWHKKPANTLQKLRVYIDYKWCNLPETNILALENGQFEDDSFLLGPGLFSGAYAQTFKRKPALSSWWLEAGESVSMFFWRFFLDQLLKYNNQLLKHRAGHWIKKAMEIQRGWIPSNGETYLPEYSSNLVWTHFCDLFRA